MSGSHLSKDFFELVKAIGESKSKQEEDRIILLEVGVLKRKMPEATVGRKKMKEFLVRMIYVEMLGHDASFGYIKAVELTASQNLSQKRSGYLTAALTLSPDHEFRFMLVNQMQRDLNSSNMLEAAAALTALCKLATVDMIPAMMTDVVRLLKHDRELVRKKAVMVLHRMNQLDADSVSHMGDHLRRLLCDKDPAVMGAALCLLHDLARVDASGYKDLVPSFVSILKQITEHRLPRDFDYHRMPAPWIQMRLLRILALLGRADRATSEGMYEVLMDVMRRADTGINVGYAVVYECVRTVTTIYPNAPLLDAAAASISRFISAENHNLKYVGVTGLAAIVRDHPKYAQEHQMAVIDCLEDPDETLKRKTLDLLYTMTNPVNVEFIAEKLLLFLEQGTDSFWRQELVKRITQCAERFAPSNSWYVRVITKVFRLAGDMVKPDVAHNLMQLIAEGSGEDEEADVQLRRDAVDSYLDLLETPAVPDQLMQVMAWVLGEYGSLVSSRGGLREVSEKLCGVASELSFRDHGTCGFVVTALMKLSAQSGEVSPPVAHLLTLYSQSKQSDLQQRSLEFLQLAREGPAAMAAVLPVDASCEDVEPDENLSHLDGIVSAALATGAVGYSPPAEADDDSDEDGEAGMGRGGGGGGASFNLTPYARPTQPAAASTSIASQQAPLPPPQSSGGAGTPLSTAEMFASGPRLRPVSKVWGRPKPGEQPQQSGAGAGASAAGARNPYNNTGALAPEVGAGAAGYPPAAPTIASGPSAGGVYDSRGRSLTGSAAPAQVEEDPAVAAQRAEKERMAAMLFGGTGARATPTGGVGSGASSAARPRPSPAPSPAKPAVSSATSSPQQQGTHGSPSAAAGADADAGAVTAAGAVGAAPVDLLDFMSMDADNSASALGATVVNGSNGGAAAGSRSRSPSAHDQLGMDLLGVGLESTGGVGGSGSGGSLLSSPQTAPQSTNGAPASANSLGNSLDDLLGGQGRGGQSESNGMSNGGNSTGNGVQGVQAWPPARQTAETTGSPPSAATMTRTPSSSMPSNGSAGAALDLSGLLLGPSAGSLTPSSSTEGAGGSGPFRFGGRAVRPLPMATGEFGTRWMACSGERKAAGTRLAPGFGQSPSPKAVVERLAARLGVHIVEIIPRTAEGICAGQLEGAGGGVCLLHCKVWAARGTVDVTVRADDAKLAEAAAAFAKTALAQ